MIKSHFAHRLVGRNSRLCWSHSPGATCDQSLDKFKVELGFFTVYGPLQKVFRVEDDLAIFNPKQINGEMGYDF
jgi:hypothetical protein